MASIESMVAKQAHTNASKASTESGYVPLAKRRKVVAGTMSDICVEVDKSDDAPPLVSQLEAAVFKAINPISKTMESLLRSLGFGDDISPFCLHEFTSSGSR